MKELVEILWPFGVFIGGCSRFGYFIDSRLDQEFRKKVRKTMNRLIHGSSFVFLFLEIFNSVFKPSRTGRPRIWRSVLASFIVLMLMILGGVFFWQDRVQHILNPFIGLPQWYIMLSFLIGTNFIGDMFSLWETRFVIGRMVTATLPFKVLLLVLDIVATVLIYCAGLVVGILMTFLASLFFNVYDYEISNLPVQIYNYLISERGLLFCSQGDLGDLLVLYFYTALFTSVWLWVFLIGMKAWPLFAWLGGIFNIDKSPVGAAMTVGSIFISFWIIVVNIFWCLLNLGGHLCV